MMVVKKKNNKAVVETKKGRHSLPEDEKKDPNTGLTGLQIKRLTDEAKGQGIPMTMLLRRIVDWYFTAMDTQRGDGETNKLFDEVQEKQHGNSDSVVTDIHYYSNT